MRGAWHRGWVGRAALAVGLAALLVPSLIGQQTAVVRAATYSVSAFDVRAGSAAEVRPRISGRVVVWQDYRNNASADIDENANADIFMRDLDKSDKSSQVNENSKSAKRPDISGDIVVWAEASSSKGLNIEGYNIAKDDHFSIDEDSGDQDFPAVSGDTVVYQSNKPGNWIIRGYHISSGKKFDISTGSSNHTAPAIDGNLVAWVDDRDGQGKTDIFGYDLNTGTEFRVTSTHTAREPAVGGPYIVYTDGASDNAGIYVYNTDDKTVRQISSTTQHARGNPRISGTIVVWQDERKGSGKPHIWGYDLATNTEFPVNTENGDQTVPDISGTTIVWQDDAHNGDIRGGDLTISGLATPTPAATATPTPAPTVTPGPPAVHDNRYFVETGFRVDNDKIWDYFQHRGKLNTFGFPVSRTFLFQGFMTQFFQRQIVQIGPDGNARLVNLLDPGLMPVNRINQSTYPAYDPAVAQAAPQPGSPNYDTAIIEFVRAHAPETFNGQPTRFWSTFNNIVTCQDAFPQGNCNESLLPGFDLEMAGAPTSNPMPDPSNANFIYLRFQRGIMHYDAGCQCTRGILLADYFKSVITGRNLPPDLDQEMQGSIFYKQYNNGMPLGLNRPGDLPNTDMTNAFEPQ